MDLLWQATTKAGAGLSTLTLSRGFDTDFTLFPGSAIAHAGGTLAAGATVTYDTYDGNNTPVFSIVPGSGGPQTVSDTLAYSAHVPPGGFTSMTSQPFGPIVAGGPFSGTAVGGSVPATNYSLLQELTYTVSGGGQLSSGDFALTIVPEPASVVLLGGIFLMTVRTIRRRRATQV